MNILSTHNGDIDYPLFTLADRVRAALGLHDRLENHVWQIAGGPGATADDARALVGGPLGSLRASLDAAVCGCCHKRLGPFLAEIPEVP